MGSHVAADEDRQHSGSPLQLVVSETGLKQCFRYIFREVQHPYQNSGLHTWLAHWIFGETSLSALFATPLYCGVLALALQLPSSIRKDIKRRKELRYACRLKDKMLIAARQSPNAVGGTGL